MLDQPRFRHLLNQVEQSMQTYPRRLPVTLFYDPIDYVIRLQGKRIRPLLTLLSAGICGARPESVIPAAAAVELLHNFTLVHDDIMDNDELRRGLPTVHVKWDLGTAILAGDGLMGLAFQKLFELTYPGTGEMARRMTNTMLIICEGQALDKMFESGQTVEENTYMEMIYSKTAALLELACELGGLAAGAGEAELERLRQTGRALGLGFQIQDDLLDVLADQAALGKKIGSDWSRHKQTILNLRLARHLGPGYVLPEAFVDFRSLLQQKGIIEEVQLLADSYFQTAEQQLTYFAPGEWQEHFIRLDGQIRNRQW